MKEKIPNYPVEALIALGHNMPLIGGKAEIRNGPEHVSFESIAIALAAGYLYEAKFTPLIIFSTGKTAGRDFPSEAQAMRDYLLAKFPHIPADSTMLEEKSKNTKENAIECANITQRYGFKRLALMSIGVHVKNAARLFERHGLPINKNRILAAETVVYSHLALQSPQQADPFISDFRLKVLLRGNSLREFIRSILLSTIDKDGNLLSIIANKTRG